MKIKNICTKEVTSYESVEKVVVVKEEVTRREKVYTLELSELEIRTLALILDRIGGHRDTTLRGVTQKMSEDIGGEVAPFSMFDEVTRETLIEENNRAIYFLPGSIELAKKQIAEELV